MRQAASWLYVGCMWPAGCVLCTPDIDHIPENGPHVYFVINSQVSAALSKTVENVYSVVWKKLVKILKLLILNDCKCIFQHCIFYAHLRSKKVAKHLISADVLV